MIVEELVAKLGVQVDPAAAAKANSFISGLGAKWTALGKKLGGVTGGLSAFASKLGVDLPTDQIDKFTAGAEGLSGGSAKIVAGVGAIAAAFGAAGIAAGLAADDLSDLASELGVSTKSLQELQFAATLSGRSIEGLEQGLKFVAKNAGLAAAGSKEMQAAFSGVNFLDANGKTRDAGDLLKDLADKFVGLDDHGKETALAMQLFGRSGAQLLPLLKRGSAGIKELTDEAASMGFVFDKQAIAAGDEFGDSLDRLKFQLQGVRNQMGAGVIPVITALIKALTFLANIVGKVLGGAVRVITSVFERLWNMLTAVWTVVTNLRNALGPLKGLFDLVAGLIAGRLLFGLLAVNAALLRSIGLWFAVRAAALAAMLAPFAPLIAIGALLFLIFDDISTYINDGDSQIGKLIETIKGFSEDNPLVRAFRFVRDAALDALTYMSKIPFLGRLIGGPGGSAAETTAPAPNFSAAPALFSAGSASTVSPLVSGGQSSSVSQAITYNITSQTDPKLIAQEIEKHQSTMLSEAKGAVKGAK